MTDFIDVSKLVTDDFVAAFRTDDDCHGIMARLSVEFYPDGLPLGVDPNDERVQQVIARIKRVQGLGGEVFDGVQ